MKNKILKSLATFGPIGYFPASGTCASLAILPLVVWLQSIDPRIYLILTLMFWLSALFIIERSLPLFPGKKDPHEIVIDEGANLFVALAFIPLSFKAISCSFILYRLFDIYKPFGISIIDRKKGALAIMLDDFCAALLANGITHFLIWQNVLS